MRLNISPVNNLGPDKIEMNITNLFSRFARYPGVSMKHFTLHSYVSSVVSVWPNFVFGSMREEFDHASIASDIDLVMREQNAPSLLLLKDTTLNRRLIESLDLFNIKATAKWVGMAVSIDELNVAPAPVGFHLETVSSSLELQKWCAIANRVLFNGELLDESLFGAMMSDQVIHLSTGYLNGIPIGTGMLYDDGTSVGVYMISVLPEHRKKGLGSAITYSLIQGASICSEQIIVLHATKMGEKVYASLGFKPLSKFFVLRKF